MYGMCSFSCWPSQWHSRLSAKNDKLAFVPQTGEAEISPKNSTLGRGWQKAPANRTPHSCSIYSTSDCYLKYRLEITVWVAWIWSSPEVWVKCIFIVNGSHFVQKNNLSEKRKHKTGLVSLLKREKYDFGVKYVIFRHISSDSRLECSEYT